MVVLSKGKFGFNFNGTERELVIPFGLKTELYKFLAKKHIEKMQLKAKTGVTEATTERITTISAELEKAKKEEPINEELVSKLSTQLERAQNDAYQEFLQNRAKVVEEALIKGIEIEDATTMELLSLILSERDEKGNITKKVEVEDLKWSQEYSEAMPELINLLQAVIEYVTETVKKISEISQMIEPTKAQ